MEVNKQRHNEKISNLVSKGDRIYDSYVNNDSPAKNKTLTLAGKAYNKSRDQLEEHDMEVAYKRDKLDADLRAKNRSDHYKLCMDENK